MKLERDLYEKQSSTRENSRRKKHRQDQPESEGKMSSNTAANKAATTNDTFKAKKTKRRLQNDQTVVESATETLQTKKGIKTTTRRRYARRLQTATDR